MRRIARIGGKLRIVGSRPKAPPREKREKAPKRSLVERYQELVHAMPAKAETPAEVRKVKANAKKQQALFLRASPDERAFIVAWEKQRTGARYAAEPPKHAEPKAPKTKPAAKRTSKPSKKAAEPKAPKAPKAKAPKAPKTKPAAKRTSKKAAEPKAPKAPKAKAPKAPKAKPAAKRTSKPSKKAAEPGKPAAKRYTPGGVLRALQELGGKATMRELRHQIGRDQLGDAVDELQRRSLIAIIPGADPEHHTIALV